MGEPGGALDEGPDPGAVQAEDEVAFPVSGNCAVVDLGGPLAEHDLGADELLAAPAGADPRHAQRSPGAQVRDQFTAQSAAALDVERLVDGLV